MNKFTKKRYMTRKRAWQIRKRKIITLLLAVSLSAAVIGSYNQKLNKEVVAFGIPSVSAQERQEYSELDALKGTPMEEAIPYIIKASKYFGVPTGYYLCIANAETSLGRKNLKPGSYNPFGIKPDGKLKYYSDWEHSVNAFSQLLKEYYLDEGKDTAETMMRKYVGYESKDWVKNCNTHLTK